MKVLMTADTVGGVWVYALELVRALGGHGVEVALATMGALPTDQQRAAASVLKNLTLFESDYKLEWMDDPWVEVTAAGEWLLDLQDQIAPDVVHLNGYVHGSLPWQAPFMVVAHSCVLSWWQAVKGELAPPEWDMYRQKVGSGLRLADALIAPSTGMLEAVCRHYAPLERGRVIYNGCNPADHQPAAKEAMVLTAGRVWDEAKNIAALQQVAPRLPWPVCVAGDAISPDGDRVACDRVRYLGRLDPPALAEWMSRASIYALPARYEPFGLSALEAAMCGCALVLGDIPSLREIWDDAAVYVSPDDHAALEVAICSLISDPCRCTELADRARRRSERYTADRMAQDYLSAYQAMQRSVGVLNGEVECGS
jgi:glycogen synthase